MLEKIFIVTGFVASGLIVLAVTPWVMKLAGAVGAIDLPDERKVHKRPMPRLGGVAIAIGFFSSIGLIWIFWGSALPDIWIFQSDGIVLFVALLFVLGLGFWDDRAAMGPGGKFVVQFLLATAVYLAGFRISSVTHPFEPGLMNLGFFDYPVTVVWIVGVTNAINLIDGLDGLASGVACIASLTIGTIAFMSDDLGTVIIAAVLAGSLLGFLRYNFNPARIFLGDSGSLFLGFFLAVVSMRSSTKGSSAFALLVPLLALGLPIMDTLLSMIRRFLSSVLRQESSSGSTLRRLRTVFLPDRSHIHHKLIAQGLSHRTSVVVLYTVSLTLGIGAFLITVVNSFEASLVLGVIAVAIVVGVRQLRYREMSLLRNGTLLPFYEFDLVNRRMFLVFLDVGFVVAAFTAAFHLADFDSAVSVSNKDVVRILGVVCGLQILSMHLLGAYKGTLRQPGVGDALRITKAVAVAVVMTGIIGVWTELIPSLTWRLLVLDFYILLTLVLGLRLSFRVLRHIARPHEAPVGRRTIIYGAGINGRLMLEKMLSGGMPGVHPVGFLDDDPNLERRTLNGHPVYGGHWRLELLINRMGINEIFITTENIKPEILKRLRSTAVRKGISLKRFTIQSEETIHESAHSLRSVANFEMNHGTKKEHPTSRALR